MRKRTRKRVWSTVAGAMGGVAAAFVMNQFQAVRAQAAEKKWAGPAVHCAFGGLVGAVYGALASSNRMAMAVWLLADEIGVPAAGLSGPPTKTPPMKHVQAWDSHLVYGLVIEAARRLILKAAPVL